MTFRKVFGTNTKDGSHNAAVLLGDKACILNLHYGKLLFIVRLLLLYLLSEKDL